MARTAGMGKCFARFVSGALQSLCGNINGGIAVGFAVTLPVLLAALGLASDYAIMTKVRGDLQSAADAAAIAGAREIPLANSKKEQIESVVNSFAAYELIADASAKAQDLAASDYSVTTEVIDNFSAVKVDISEAWTPFFAHFLVSGITPVSVSATARYVGRNNVCVLGLATDKTAILLDRNSMLTGNNCGFFSNSNDAKGLSIDTGAEVKATIICSAGGAHVSTSTVVQPSAITDCPPVPDPLASRVAPSFGGCDHNDLSIDMGTATLGPGVYCGGLEITGTASAFLSPGVYVIKDGNLQVSGQATMTGEGVGFYLTGTAGPVKFTAKTHISLEAPKDGPMAGLLLFEDRALTKGLKHKITSDDARVLLGTIYLPVGELVIDAKDPVADQSAFTAIVVQRLDLNMGPNLVLNSDYGSTDVPVPNGISGSSRVVLSD